MNFVEDSCTRNKEHALSWERIPRLASGVRPHKLLNPRILVTTELSSEYFIPENLHPELPGPEDHIVDFPE
ncbi:hypothetical protein Tco_1426548, partial [Tanacetum coccineum]